MKQIHFEREAIEKLLSGVNQLANTVKQTLGPSGCNVVYEGAQGSPVITKDGVTVARQVILPDPIENMGAELVKEAASRTARGAGDGTTTATLLTQEIFSEGAKAIIAGHNRMEIKKGIEMATKHVVENLAKQSKQISDDNEIENVARISSNNDHEIGKIIAEAIKKVGKEGIITIEPSNRLETSVQTTNGMQLKRGYLHPSFINTPKNTVELEKPLIMVCDRTISRAVEVVSILEHCIVANQPLVVIAENIEGEALGIMAVNKMRGISKVVAIKAPEMGDRMTTILEDIAITTGATVISEIAGMKLENAKPEYLGTCEKIIVTDNSTTIIHNSGSLNETQKIDLAERELQIKHKIEEYEKAQDEYMLRFHRSRLANLTGKIGVIYVGGATESEMKERMDRVDDALRATQAAIEEGIVPGGGLALLRALQELDQAITVELTESEKVGVRILKNSLTAPATTIIENTGAKADLIIQKLLETKDPHHGYNARSHQYENLMENGVVDPTKVTRLAIQNASSIAGLLLSTKATITRIPNQESE